MGYQQPMAVDPPLTCAPRHRDLPNRASLLRMVGTLLQEQDDEWTRPRSSVLRRHADPGSLAPGDMRGALFGSIYILIYDSISVPTVLAGAR
jgi:hypothetical protein